MASSDERKPILYSCKTFENGKFCANLLEESHRFCNKCGSKNQYHQPDAPEQPRLSLTVHVPPQGFGRGRGILALSGQERDHVLKQRDALLRSQHSPENLRGVTEPKNQSKNGAVDESTHTDDAETQSGLNVGMKEFSDDVPKDLEDAMKSHDSSSVVMDQNISKEDEYKIYHPPSSPTVVENTAMNECVQTEGAGTSNDSTVDKEANSASHKDPNPVVKEIVHDQEVKRLKTSMEIQLTGSNPLPRGEKQSPGPDHTEHSIAINNSNEQLEKNDDERNQQSGSQDTNDSKTCGNDDVNGNIPDNDSGKENPLVSTETSDDQHKDGQDQSVNDVKPGTTGGSDENGHCVFGSANPNYGKQGEQSGNSITGTGQAYRKGDNVQPDYVAPQKQTNQTETRSQTRSHTKNQPTIDVTFEVVTSPSVKMQAKASDVYIKFSAYELGDWKKQWGPMQKMRSTEDGFVVYQMTVAVPKYLITYNQSVEYKYIVHRKDKNKIKWEHLFIKKFWGSNTKINRVLSIPRTHDDEKDWKQYDGIMLKTPKTLMGIKWKNIPYREEEIKRATHIMLPKWEGFSTKAEENAMVPAEDILDQVDQVIYCLQRRLRFEEMDQSIVKNILLEYISPRLEILQLTNQETESEEIAGMRLASAIAIVHVIVKHELFDQSRRHSEAICRSLLLRPDLADFIIIEAHFENSKEKLVNQLKMLLLKGLVNNDHCEPMWVLVIPLYHLLRDDNKNRNADYKATNKWWGTTGIQDILERFHTKKRLQENDILEYKRCLEPLFKHDVLLPRTLMAIVTYKKMTEDNMTLFTPEAVLANIRHELITHTHYVEEDELHQKLELLICLLVMSQAKVIDLDEQTELMTQQKAALFQAEIGEVIMNLLKYRMSESRRYRLFTSLITVIAQCLTTFDKANEKIDEKTPLDDKRLTGLLGSITDVLDHWLGHILPSSPLKWKLSSAPEFASLADIYEMDILHELMSTRMGPEELDNIWQSRIRRFLKHRYLNVDSMSKMEIYCVTSFKSNQPELEKFFTDMAFDAVEDVCKKSNYDFKKLFTNLGSSGGFKIKAILSQVFTKMWPEEARPEKILHLVLTWPAFVRYLDMLLGKEGHSSFLSEELQVNIPKALSVFTEMVEKLKTGNVTIKSLQYLQTNSESILNVQRAIDRNSASQNDDASSSGLSGINNAQVLLKVLNWRKQELFQFNIIKKNLAIFSGMCRMIEPACSDEELKALDKKLNHSVDDLFISNICKPQQYTQQTATERTYHPNINFFKVDQEILTCAENLSRYKENYTFMQLWNKFGKNKQSASFEEIVEHVWNPTLREFKTIYNGLKTGSITFQQINLYYRNHDNDNDLKKEYMDMAKAEDDDTKWIKQRVEQIRQFRALHRSQIGAKVMMGMKDKFKLTGNFDVLKLLTSSENHKSMQLKQMTPELVDAGNELKGIDDAKVNCLKVYLDCSELVVWLKESLEGPRQVKVLVDLAMITASGQGDMEVTKVKYLHAAVIGYTPLIYELKPDASFQMFLEQCKSVWRALETDKKLPDKLKTINQHREWLKKVKDSKGSMEVSAFAQVEMINKRGAYKIGNIKKANPKSTDDALSLTILPENGAENKEIQVYTFQQLNDLQSKLMLVAGKATEGKEEVDRFVEVFDGVTRLAALYIKLCNAGSILFKNWNCTFFCDPNRPVNTNIDFGLSEHILNGTKDVKVVDQISDICKFLEECLKDWIHHIEIKRQEHVSLNFYTTEQLVILRRELALLCKAGGQVPYSIFPMLSDVCPDCKENNLKDAMNGAYRDLKELERAGRADTTQDSASVGSDSEQSSDESQPDEAEQMRDLIDSLMESGYPERLCQKALKECGPNLQDAMMWCMEKMGEDDSSSDSSEDSKDRSDSFEDPSEQEVNLGISTTLQGLTSDLLQRITEGDNTLAGQLSDMWTSYLENVSTSVSDYLSVEHLGFVLTQLAGQVDETRNRPYPEYLQLDKPNLIVCPKAQLLHTILALFMHREGQDQPLPQRDEVLLCNHTTSAEQVELLLRRATSEDASHNGKLYCLADVGSLDYDVALKAEKFFEKHCKAKKTLRLIVICSQETEDRSHVVTFLEQHRVPYTSLYKPRDAQAYLKKHFIVDKPGTAPMLDPDRCSVRIIKSHRAGVGKTLKVRRLHAKLMKMLPGNRRHDNDLPLRVKIPLHRREVDASRVIQELFVYTPDPDRHTPRIFHIDIAHEVHEGVDHLLFDLLVLGSLMDRDGTVWRRCHDDLYIIETMPLLRREVSKQKADVDAVSYVHTVLQLLPALTCWSPEECLLLHQRDYDAMKTRYPDFAQNDHDQLMDDVQFRSTTFQRPYQYLERLATGANLREVEPRKVHGDHVSCLRTLISHCGVRDPSWAELCHFVHFLNLQLRDCELSDFCHPGAEEDLPNFRNFVVKFMIVMSKDFATRSLKISEETPGTTAQEDEDEDEDGNDEDGADNHLVQYQMKRQWETSPHPYIFFNADPHSESRHSMTFLGFNVTPTGDIIDPLTNNILERGVLPRNLQQPLVHNKVQLNENFDGLPRHEKIMRICAVFGMDMPHDPDPTYELTTDNVKKILAIHMRFRCEIPVVVMGETGCGKTRLVKFMCDLQKPPRLEMQNLVLMKVHGGTTDEEIMRKVERAGRLAITNRQNHPRVDTVLFFDEANTTDAIGLIKEILCDGTMRGQPLPAYSGLKFVVACNPYRKHSDEVIKTLEQAGLGYHIQADETKDKLGRIPMRQLVYRVHALPQSMLPLVWDFGQLNARIEELYIRQMVTRYINESHLPNLPHLVEVTSAVLSASQEFMKQQKDECSFVSLRDVDRVLQVMTWFYAHGDQLFPLMDREDEEREDEEEDEDEEEPNVPQVRLHPITRSLILALGACYHACLQKRREYRQHVSRRFTGQMALPRGPDTIETEINRCQEVFLAQIDLPPNIARNQALKENLFMMVVCIELRIPLFLVGKPGSSKSLAKTIVTDAMQGDAAQHDLFRQLKLVHMISFQCSPLSTADGIIGTFRQCAQLQEDKDLTKFVAVVVLDEVGLAEDSPLMPLKTLHPLLEDGCAGEEEPAPHKKVACIAISNWALDPAKMNRGIHVQRGVPDIQELEDSAKGICQTDPVIQAHISTLVKPLADGYLKLYKKAIKEKREFFGLRDFYSLMKMVYGFSNYSKKTPSWYQLQHAILRNFGGLDRIDPVEVFSNTIHGVDKQAEKSPEDPDCTPSAMIRASVHGDGLTSESRYLLILTENYAALGILQQQLLDQQGTTVIFGSSFPKDQEYTQVCRNINKIKVCMEAGRTVVLLNLENLYESLYDALNQYYVKLGDARFVDLGLGTQRVKCEVHANFKLVVVAEKQVVYQKFPIPLINRLEKHFLAMSNMLTEAQISVADRLERWAETFTETRGGINIGHRQRAGPRIEDVFIGYSVDSTASVVMQVCHKMMDGRDDGDEQWADQVFEMSQDLLLQCATPDAVVRLRDTHKAFYDRYFTHQQHGSLQQLLHQQLAARDHRDGLFLQVTTHSKLLSNADVQDITRTLRLERGAVRVASLQAFDTEHQFTKTLRDFLQWRSSRPVLTDKLLVLQCDCGDQSGDLIASCRYILQDEYDQTTTDAVLARTDAVLTHVVLVVQLPRVGRGSFVGFQGGRWLSYHIDDLHPQSDPLPSLKILKENSVSTLFEESLKQKQIPMEVDNVEQTDEDLMMSPESGIGPGGDAASMENSWVKLDEPGEEPMSEEDTDLDVETEMDFEGSPEGSGEPVEKILANEIAKASAEERIDENDLLNVDRLIRKCIHGAAAMVKDYETDASRKTKRVEILLKLLDEKDAVSRDENSNMLSILDVINIRICRLLKDKEEQAMTGTMATSWLCNEAASVDSVNRAGTFRRALWQCLESKVTPMLAGLLAFSDRNRNLDLLVSHDQSHWLHQYWLRMLANQEATMLTYKDLQTVTQRLELSEFQVESSGCERTLFSAVLPFSWTLYHQINALMYQARTDKLCERPEDLVTRLGEQTALGRIIIDVVQETHAQEFIDMYLEDFVCMAYKPQSSDPRTEYQFIKDSIRNAAAADKNRHRQDPEEDPENLDEPQNQLQMTPPGIHQTYSVIQRRLHLCSQAFQVWPEGVARIRQAQEDPDDTPELFQSVENGMSLDVQILYVMVLELAPDFAQFDHEKNSKTYRKAWLGRVETFRPIIDRILKSIEEDGGNYGRVCDKYQQKARHFWTRINVLYLFLQHICPPNEQNKGKKEMYNCRALWMVLKDDTDFKKEKSLTAVQKFLVTCNKVASQHFFTKKLKTCDRCKDTMNSPTKLPCKDIYCLRCVQEMKALNNTICPQCKKAFPADFIPRQIADKKEEIEAHNQYKRRCNAFFMDVVSRYCFHGNAPPEPGVINMLLGYVTCEYKMAAAAEPEVAERHRTRTCPPTLFRDSIDPTPVVRSFLLQLLLQSNIDDVREHLDDYFKRCRDLFTDPRQILELCVLCVNCLEDYYHSRFTKLPSKPEKRLEFVVNHLNYYTNALNLDRLDMTRLDTLGCMRFCLGEVAEILHDELIQKAGDVGPRQQALLIMAKIACEQGQVTEKGITPTALYLLKQINARFGLNVLQQIGDTDHGRWVIPAAARPNEADVQPDRFVILGDGYKTLRNKLVEVMMGEPSEGMVQAYQAERGNAAVKERDVLLAVYREVTQGLVRENADQRPSQPMLASVAKLCTQDLKLKHQDLLDKLLTNQLGQLTVRPRPPGQEAELVELLLHYWLVLASAEGGKLLQPLVNLMKNPAAMRDAFLPTMPEDNLEEVRAALLEARQRGRGDENPVMYQCPNGHPYVIGNCGRPVVGDHCKACGAPIGGHGYNLNTGNTLAPDNQNRTSPGHILGAADQRSTVAVPERLSPAATSTLRLLVHMAMYLGANHDTQAVSALIRSPAGLPPPDTAAFLWRHLVRDVEVLGRAVGRSLEDCAVLVHSLLGNICDRDVGGLGGIDHHLRTKEDRRNWEQRFAPVMAPILQDIDQRIQAATTLMVNDNRIGNNPLLRALYEVDTAATDEAATPAATPEVSILREPCVWRLRARITVEHLSQQFQETVGQAPAGRGQGAARNTPAQRLPVLGLFFEQEHHLRALRCLPGVMKLQRLLSQKLHRNIDGAEATKMTIKQFRDEHIQRHMRDEFRELLQNFIDAWKLVKGELGTFAVGGSVVPAQYCDRDITDSTSLALLLPATRGHGLCATALVYFLVDTHNSFMEEYARIRGISLPAGQATSSREVTLAHLVAFDPQRDLAPVLLAHCHYELTLGGATAQSTDFEGLEKAVEERFVRGRARVTAEVHPVVFRQELTTSTVLSQLDARLPQELSLTGGLTAQILADHRHLTDLNTSLATLDITLGFLVAVGGHDAITGDMPLSEFVSGTLKMSAGKLGRAGLGAAHRCQLRHVRALWLTLATERAKLLTDGQQDAFDSLDPAYKDPLPGALTEALTTHLQHRDPRDPRGGLSSGLFEYILLRLTAPKDKNAEDYQDDRDYPLYYTLGEYLEERGYPTIPSLGDGRFPQEVLLKHSVSTWGLVLKAEREAR